MKKHFAGGVLIALTYFMLTGCSTFELEMGRIDCCDTLKMATESTTETIHGSIYNFKWSDHHVSKCGSIDHIDSLKECGIYRVEYHTNAFYILASFLSLGLYVPQTIEYWCALERRDDAGKERYTPSGRTRRSSSNDKSDGDGRMR